MMHADMPTASLSGSLTYTPPGSGTAVSVSLNVVSNYTAQQEGTLDIPDGTAGSTVFPLDFGSINVNAQALYVKNTNNQDMILRLNGSANLYRIPPGGQVMVSHPADPAAGFLLSADLVTTALQVGDGAVSYYVFGE